MGRDNQVSTDNDKKKVLVDGRCFINKGSSVAVYLHNIIEYLAQNDRFIIYLVINNPGYKEEYKDYSNVNPIFVNIRNNIIWDHLVVPYMAIKCGCQIVFYPKSSSCGYRLPGKKIITTIHGVIYEVEKHNIKPLERIYWKTAGKTAARVADKVIAVSESDKEDLVNYFGCRAGKITVIPIGVNKNFLSPASNREAGEILNSYGLDQKKYFIQVGSLIKKKNQLFTLSILKDYLLSNRQYKVLFLGPTDRDSEYYEKVLAYINHHSLEGQVVFSGSIDQNIESDRMSLLVQNAILGLFPSSYEGFGIPPLEMIALGVPVLISNRGALKEVYGEANTLPLEEKTWMAELKKLLADRDYYNNLVNRQKKILKNYSRESIGSKYLELFTEQG